jgi:hypothetical protein
MQGNVYSQTARFDHTARSLTEGGRRKRRSLFSTRNGVKTMFQHRHYKAIAAIVADLNDDIRERVAKHFANALVGTNPRYNIHRFFTAAVGDPAFGRDKVMGGES